MHGAVLIHSLIHVQMIATRVNAQSEPTARSRSIAPKRFAVAKTRPNRAKSSKLERNGRRKTIASVVNVSTHSKSNASKFATLKIENPESLKRQKLSQHTTMP